MHTVFKSLDHSLQLSRLLATVSVFYLKEFFLRDIFSCGNLLGRVPWGSSPSRVNAVGEGRGTMREQVCATFLLCHAFVLLPIVKAVEDTQRIIDP